MQQSGGLLPPTARRRRSLISRVPPGVPSFSANIIWWVWPSWLRRQIVALKIVGSSPIIHPIKKKHSYWSASFLWNGYRIRRERPTRRVGKKVSGGHFFSSGENPRKADGTPQGVLATFHFSIWPATEPGVF